MRKILLLRESGIFYTRYSYAKFQNKSKKRHNISVLTGTK